MPYHYKALNPTSLCGSVKTTVLPRLTSRKKQKEYQKTHMRQQNPEVRLVTGAGRPCHRGGTGDPCHGPRWAAALLAGLWDKQMGVNPDEGSARSPQARQLLRHSWPGRSGRVLGTLVYSRSLQLRLGECWTLWLQGLLCLGMLQHERGEGCENRRSLNDGSDTGLFKTF